MCRDRDKSNVLVELLWLLSLPVLVPAIWLDEWRHRHLPRH